MFNHELYLSRRNFRNKRSKHMLNIKKQNYLIMNIYSKTFIISYRYFPCFIKMKLNIKYKNFKALFIYVTNIANLKIFFIVHNLLINYNNFF